MAEYIYIIDSVNGNNTGTGTVTPSIACTISDSTDKVSDVAHGLANGTAVQFAATTTLPSPLAASTDYYVVNKTADDFEVSATFGGAKIDITDAGTGDFTYSTSARWDTLANAEADVLANVTSAAGHDITYELVGGDHDIQNMIHSSWGTQGTITVRPHSSAENCDGRWTAYDSGHTGPWPRLQVLDSATAYNVLTCQSVASHRAAITIDGIEVVHDKTGFTSESRFGSIMFGGRDRKLTVNNCVFHDFDFSKGGVLFYSRDTSIVIRNTTIFNFSSTAAANSRRIFGNTGANGRYDISNCAFHNIHLGEFMALVNESPYFNNNILTDITWGTNYETNSEDRALTNYTDLASAPDGGTDVWHTTGWSYGETIVGIYGTGVTDPSTLTPPFSLDAGGLAETATDLSANARDPFNWDQADTTRGTWTIGPIHEAGPATTDVLINASNEATGQNGETTDQQAKLDLSMGGDTTHTWTFRTKAAVTNHAAVFLRGNGDYKTGRGIALEAWGATGTDISFQIYRLNAEATEIVHHAASTGSTDQTLTVSASVVGNNWTVDWGPVSNPTQYNATFTDAVAVGDESWIWFDNEEDIVIDDFSASGAAGAAEAAGTASIVSASAGEFSVTENGGILTAAGMGAGFQLMNGGING